MNRLLRRRYCLPRAIGDILFSLPGLFEGCLSHEARESLSVGRDFFGINVASSEDELCDDYVLNRLRELGINHVRLALSYDSPGGAAERFLESLLANRFRVALVVLPPLEEARRLLDDRQAQEQWREFVAEVFRRYAQQVEFFEIGSTPNRRRWSGFSPRGYLQAWQIACEAAQGFEVTLAGPNVQDFEPFYNAAFLAAMGRMGRVPEIHTDNLFVERVIEPEAYDHRVLGRWATGLLRLNLIKKARILKYLGDQAGCRQTFSTCQFWTTKRLSRWSAYPQDKKADYLVRYLLLAVSSGSLGRVYWGPLICGRDGLIDDGSEDYPTVDHSTFYQKVRGSVDDCITTPAFFALAYLVRRLAQSRCVQAVNRARGINHFVFKGADGKLFHVCWCRDGQAYWLKDLYSEEHLAEAVFTNVVGEIVSSPVVVTERPLFIDFPQQSTPPLPNYPQGKKMNDSEIVYASLPESQGLPWENEQWRGAFTRIASQPDLSLGDDLVPERLILQPELAVLRDRRNRLWNIVHPRHPGRQLTVKFNRPRGIKRLTYLFKPSKGRRHWNTASSMLQRGVSTPAPVAFYERHRYGGVRDSYYICEYIPDAFSSRQVCHAFQQGQTEYRGLDKLQWFSLLTGFICQMHSVGILHLDLSVGNLMLVQKPDGEVTPYFIDIGRARVVTKVLDGHQRILDLMRICYKLDWPDRELFIACYCKHWGNQFSSLWRLMVRYYDLKQGSKKYLKAKLSRKR